MQLCTWMASDLKSVYLERKRRWHRFMGYFISCSYRAAAKIKEKFRIRLYKWALRQLSSGCLFYLHQTGWCCTPWPWPWPSSPWWRWPRTGTWPRSWPWPGSWPRPPPSCSRGWRPRWWCPRSWPWPGSVNNVSSIIVKNGCKAKELQPLLTLRVKSAEN